MPATKKTNQWNWTLAVQRPPIGRFIFNEIGLSIDSQCPLSVHFSEPIISQSNSLSLSSYPAGIKATETKECPSDAKKTSKKNSYFSLYSPHRHIHYIFFVCNSLENFFNFFFKFYIKCWLVGRDTNLHNGVRWAQCLTRRYFTTKMVMAIPKKQNKWKDTFGCKRKANNVLVYRYVTKYGPYVTQI